MTVDMSLCSARRRRPTPRAMPTGEVVGRINDFGGWYQWIAPVQRRVLEVCQRMPIDPGKLPSMLAAGVVVGLITVISALAFAGLIVAGPLAPCLLAGISALLLGGAISCALIALTSRYPGLVAAPSPSAPRHTH